jgi:20S proteasome alpha/beta subunit
MILCADSEETLGDDQKHEAEKLYVSGTYPLAIGGAGLGEAIDAFAQELISAVERDRPTTISALKELIRTALKENHEKDAAYSDWSLEYRKAQYLIGAWPNHDKAVLFRVRGKRIYRVKQRVVIGFATAANEVLFRRMYRPNLPMQQAVMLAIYLVSHSKAVDQGVGGQTAVAVVNGDIAWLDYPEYVAMAEARVNDFIRLTDDLFLYSVDAGIAPSKFPEILSIFGESVTRLREQFANQSAAVSLGHALHDPEYRGEPYSKLFMGAVINTPPGGQLQVTEESEEVKEERRQRMEAASKAVNAREAGEEFLRLITGRQIEYLGEETITIQGEDSA